MQHHHEAGQAQPVGAHPALAQGHEVVVNNEGEQREHHAGAARCARVDAGHGQAQQHKVEGGECKAQPPSQLGAVGGQRLHHEVVGGAGLHRLFFSRPRGRTTYAGAVQAELADLHAGLVSRGLQALAVAQQGHAFTALGLQPGAAGGGDRFAFAIIRSNEDVVGRQRVRGVLVDEEHAAAVGGFLELARGDAVDVAALLVAGLEFLDLGVGPWPHQQRQHGDHHHHRPGKSQQGAHQADQTPPAGEPDHHFAVAVHARQRADDRNEQAEAENGGQLPQYGEAHDEHHVGRADAALGGLTQCADEHHGHDHGHQHHKGRAEAARQLLADG